MSFKNADRLSYPETAADFHIGYGLETAGPEMIKKRLASTLRRITSEKAGRMALPSYTSAITKLNEKIRNTL